MWFKNLTLFRLIEPLDLMDEHITTRLERFVFQPCPSYLPSAAGWVPPLGRKAVDLVHGVAGKWLLCLRTEEKILPASVLSQAVAEQVTAIEDQENRSVRRRERQELRDRLLQAWLPHALLRSRYGYAYLDPQQRWLVLDSVSPRGVEEMTGFLRKSLDSLPITPVKVQRSVTATMTAWLAEGQAPPDFAFGDSCELRESGEPAGIIRCRGQDLTSDEIRAHLAAGKQVARLGLIWKDRVSFVLDEALTLRRLRFLEIVEEAAKESAADSHEARFDTEFALMTGELGLLLPRLLELFGGDTG